MKIPYSGGPIVKCPMVYTSFWGPNWSDNPHKALAGRMNTFVQDVIQSSFMNVLTQYGVLGPKFGAFVQASYLPWVPNTLTVASYENIIQSCISGGFLPDP